MVEQQGYEERAVAVMERPDAIDPAGPDGRAITIIRPVASSEEVLAAWQQFQELKRSLLTLDDYQEVQGRPRIKKSGWRKIAAAFGISDQILREERRDFEPPAAPTRYFVWEISVRAVAPNGRYADAVGSCASNERRFAHLDHDTRAVAHCVPLDAEILTRRGFRRFDEVAVGDDVLGYCVEDDRCYWTPLQAVTVYDRLPMRHLTSKGLRVYCTPDHSWAVRSERGRGRESRRWLCPTDQLPTRGGLILAAPAEPGLSRLSPEDAARLGWILTEGTVRYQYVGQQYKGKTYRNGPYLRVHIDQSKPEYVSELRELVGAIASERITTLPPRTYPQGHTSDLRPSHRFELRSTEARSLFARVGLDEGGDVLTLLPQLSVAAREAMLDAMLKGDGGRHGSTWVFNQADPHVMEIFQVLATLTGRALGRMQTAHAGIGNGPCLRQTIRVRRYIDLDALQQQESTAQAAWCPTTAYGTWIMRLGGQVMITGNTRAKNRAVADLVGGGEVSAEEIDVMAVEHAALPNGRTNGTVADAPPTAESAPSEPAAWNGDAATDAQLRAIRAHLRRTGIDEERACARAGVDSLDGLSRRAAAQLLGQLSRQPNAA